MALLFGVLSSTLALGNAEWTIFENPDKTKRFTGRLVSYDSKKAMVTVQKRSNLQTVTFRLNRLSDEHQEFVKDRAVQLEAAGGLRMDFFKSMEPVSTVHGDERSRTKNYNGGFQIKIRNHATKMLEDVEVEYIAVYRKDEVNGPGEVLTKEGSYQVSFLMPGLDETVVTDTIPMTAYYKPGKVTQSAGST